MDDTLSAAAITDNLATRFVGQRVVYYPTLSSTIEVARQEAQLGAAEGIVVIADEQSAGRGRLNRVWLSPEGSISLSVILYPPLSYIPFLIMISSLAVLRSIQAVTGLKPQLKWPNDVLINGRKVSGMLVESKVQGKAVKYAVVSIGVNVNLNVSEFPEPLPFAASLSDELGRYVSRLDLVRHLLVEIEELYLALPDGCVYQEWRNNLVTLGRRVRVKSGKDNYQGIAEDVASDGSLKLRRPNGSLAKIVAGDVTFSD